MGIIKNKITLTTYVAITFEKLAFLFTYITIPLINQTPYQIQNSLFINYNIYLQWS